MEEKDNEVTEETEKEEELKEEKPCFHQFVNFRNRRKCIICGMEMKND